MKDFLSPEWTEMQADALGLPAIGVRTLPGHPVKAGAGYDCNCGGCLSLPVRREEYEREAGHMDNRGAEPF